MHNTASHGSAGQTRCGSTTASDATEKGRLNAGEARRPFHYARTHLPSGRVHTQDFTASQAWQWGGDDWQHVKRSVLQDVSHGLISGWNRVYRDLYRYELREGPAPVELGQGSAAAGALS